MQKKKKKNATGYYLTPYTKITLKMDYRLEYKTWNINSQRKYWQ